MNKQLSEKIQEKINQRQLEPVSRGWVLLKKAVVWVLLGLSTLISASTLALIVFRTSQLRRLPYREVGVSIRDQLIDMAPIIFVASLMIGLILAIYEFGKTDKGYRFEKIKVTLSLIGIITVLAATLHFSGVNRALHQSMFNDHNLVPRLDDIRQTRFNRPDRGVIAGIVSDDVLTTRRNNRVLLIRGESLSVETFNSIQDQEQPVILFGRPDQNGFIVCSLQSPIRQNLDFERNYADIRNNSCEAAIEPNDITTN